jgi:thiol-disulfide isomerase/thioredoxin
MAAVESTMLPLGTTAPPFHLPDYDGAMHSLEQFPAGKPLLVAFICNHCPFVRHIRAQFARFAREYQARGLSVVAIASNDIEAYPQDGPAGMAEEARSAGYGFPYLLDATQEVARAYRAACTPDFFLFEGKRRLAYRGQFDGSRPGNGVALTGADLRAACDAVLAGQQSPAVQKPSVGCNIKWKKGNEPDYFGS